jgi:hypothetical protein
MDLRHWLKKLKPQQQAQPLVSQNLPNGSRIPSVTEEVQATKKKQSLMG